MLPLFALLDDQPLKHHYHLRRKHVNMCSGTRRPCPVSYWFLHETYESGSSIDELHHDGIATNVLLMIDRTGSAGCMLASVGCF